MVNPIRRKLLKTGAAAAAVAATPSVLAQQSGSEGGGRFYQKGNVRIRYEETGSGFPLLLIPEPRSGEIEIVLPERRPDGSPGLVRAAVPAPRPPDLPDALVARPGEDAAAVAERRRRAFDPAVPARRLIAAGRAGSW